MNVFGLDTGQLDPDEAGEILCGHLVERLPGVPVLLSKEECASILGISIKVVSFLIESGELPFTEIPSDASPSSDLFGELTEQPYEKCVLRADLIEFMEKALLCNKPVL